MNLFAEAFDLVGALRRDEISSNEVAAAMVELTGGDVEQARDVLKRAVDSRERLARIAEEDRNRPRVDGRPEAFTPGGEARLAEAIADARRAREEV